MAPLYLLAHELGNASCNDAALALTEFLQIASDQARTLADQALQDLQRLQGEPRDGRGRTAQAANQDRLVLPRSLFGERSSAAGGLAAICAGSPRDARLLVDLYHQDLQCGDTFIRPEVLGLHFPLVAENDGDIAGLALFDERPQRHVTPVGPLVNHADGLLIGGGRTSGPTARSWVRFWQSLDVLCRHGFAEWYGSLRIKEAGESIEKEWYRLHLDEDGAAASAISTAIRRAGQKLSAKAVDASGISANLAQASIALPIPPQADAVRLIGILRLNQSLPDTASPCRQSDDAVAQSTVDQVDILAWLKRLEA